MRETKSTESTKIIEHFEKGAKFDADEDARRVTSGRSDHQMMHEMYTVTALPVGEIKNQWDIFTSSAPVPAANEPLEAIAATPEENGCKFAA